MDVASPLIFWIVLYMPSRKAQSPSQKRSLPLYRFVLYFKCWIFKSFGIMLLLIKNF